MALDGKWDFTPPPWVALVQAARHLGVAPWDLEAQPIKWRDRALVLMEAEAHKADMDRERSRR